MEWQRGGAIAMINEGKGLSMPWTLILLWRKKFVSCCIDHFATCAVCVLCNDKVDPSIPANIDCVCLLLATFQIKIPKLYNNSIILHIM